jgi:endonuclease YncB( thermonuclease family)
VTFRRLTIALAGVATVYCLPFWPEAKSDPAKGLSLRVVGVHDGDTLTGLSQEKTQVKVRLDAIDAPELGQPFGRASKAALSDLVFGKDVVVYEKSKDRWGRTVGHVLVDGKDTNLEMLRAGMAWHYKKYDQNRRLAAVEEEAKSAKVGLWRDPNSIPPWEWRKTKRTRSAQTGKSTAED